MNHVEIGADWFRNPFGTVYPERRVRANRRRIEIDDGKIVLPCHLIKHAFYAPREGARGRVVVIAADRPRIAIEVLTRDEAKRLLDALGWSAERKPLRLRGQSIFRRYVAFTLMVLAVLMGVWDGVDDTPAWSAPFANHVAVLLLISAFLYWFLTPSILVGSDGVVVRRVARGLRRFISYDDIARARHVISSPNDQSGQLDHVLVLERKAKGAVRIHLRRGERNEDDAAGVVERIQEAMEARAAHELPFATESLLARGERSVAEWLDGLRRIHAADEVHYRVAPVDRESLFGAVEDATKKPELRVAAAIALGRELDDEGRARLRVYAEAVAEPKLRAALEQIADGADTDALAKILQDLDGTAQSEG